MLVEKEKNYHKEFQIPVQIHSHFIIVYFLFLHGNFVFSITQLKKALCGERFRDYVNKNQNNIKNKPTCVLDKPKKNFSGSVQI